MARCVQDGLTRDDDGGTGRCTVNGQPQFPLEGVLRYRRLQKGVERAAMEDALLERDRLNRELIDCRHRLARLEAELGAAGGRPVDVKSIIITRSYIRCLQAEESRLIQLLSEQEHKVEECRVAVVNRSQEERILEKARDRFRSSVRRAEQRRSARLADERALGGSDPLWAVT